MADHRGHDPILVAAAADRGGRLADALAACSDCLTLFRDLRLLALATPTAAMPRRPRDLRLTMDDARRLRRRGWSRLLAVLDGGRDAVIRPLALGLTTLGLVGLLLSTVPTGPLVDVGVGPSAVVDTSQPLRATDALGGSEAAGTPGQMPVDESGSDPRPTTTSGDRLRMVSLTLLGLGLGAFVVRRRTSSRDGVR